MNAALDDHIGIHLRRFLRKLQAVACNVAHAVEDFRRLIVMREDDGAALFLQPVDGVDIGREKRPLDGGNDVANLLVERLHFLRKTGRIFKLRHVEGLEFACGGLLSRLLLQFSSDGHFDLLSLHLRYTHIEYILGIKNTGTQFRLPMAGKGPDPEWAYAMIEYYPRQ